jgi:CubicO group peptidase (beta-lactamase class C family)
MKCILLALSVIWSGVSCHGQTPPDQHKIVQDIDGIRTRFHIPGIAFGMANCDGVLLSGAVGVREIGTTNLVAVSDSFHIGSLAKGLLAFVAAKLVDEGKISWDTKFFDLYPEMRPTAREGYYGITLKDLLSHRALLQPFNDSHSEELIDKYNALNEGGRFSTTKFASFGLTLEPVKYEPGQFYKYSTLGYLLASLMLEKASGLSYAQLIAKTNEDLGVNFQIGWPMSNGKFQPSGHVVPKERGWGEGSSLTVWNGDKFTDWGEDYLFYATPAGHLNVPVLDLLKYLQLCLNGVNGRNNYLKAATYDFIFNGAKEYSMGWGNEIVKGNHYYSHRGSIGTFIAFATIIKEPKTTFAIVANAGNDETKDGLLQVRDLLEAAYAK